MTALSMLVKTRSFICSAPTAVITVRLRTETTKAVPSIRTRASLAPLAEARPIPSWSRAMVASPTSMPRRRSRSSAWPEKRMPAVSSSFARRTPSKLAAAPSAAGAAGVGRGAPTPGGASAGLRRTGSADIGLGHLHDLVRGDLGIADGDLDRSAGDRHLRDGAGPVRPVGGHPRDLMADQSDGLAHLAREGLALRRLDEVRDLLQRRELRHLAHEVLVVHRVHRVLVLELGHQELQAVVLPEDGIRIRPGRGSTERAGRGRCDGAHWFPPQASTSPFVRSR